MKNSRVSKIDCIQNESCNQMYTSIGQKINCIEEFAKIGDFDSISIILEDLKMIRNFIGDSLPDLTSRIDDTVEEYTTRKEREEAEIIEYILFNQAYSGLYGS